MVWVGQRKPTFIDAKALIYPLIGGGGIFLIFFIFIFFEFFKQEKIVIFPSKKNPKKATLISLFFFDFNSYQFLLLRYMQQFSRCFIYI